MASTKEDDQFSFIRTFKYSRKDNENPFNVRYYGRPADKDASLASVPSNQKSAPVDGFKPSPLKPKPEPQARVNVKKQQHDFKASRKAKELQELKEFSKINFKAEKKAYKKNQDKAEKQNLKKMQRAEQKQAKKKEKAEKKLAKKQQKYLGQGLSSLNRLRSRSTEPQPHRSTKNSYNHESFEYKKNRLNNDSFKKHRTEAYDQYMSIEDVEDSRANNEGRYFKGTIEFNERIKWFAKIKSLEVDGNLVAEGKNRNRCIHEDEVYFEIVEQTDLKTFCKIVCIIPQEESRQIVGKIEFLESKRLYYLTPINPRFITMNIRMNEIEKAWLKQINEQYFLAEFHNWDRDSEYPFCTVIDRYGKFGDVDVEANALLKTHNVYEQNYTEEQITEGLKKFIDRADINGQYQISEEQIAKRLDLRNQRIFTIDPLTARDFDDALSVSELSQKSKVELGIDQKKEVYEIGVHIADASFFCEEGSIIDSEAQKRTTSVYLVHKVLPMLPRVLCETMCSLNPGLERLTLSIWFYIDIEGFVYPGARYDRTVIKSKARFTYEQAQEIIEGKVQSQSELNEGYGCVDPKDDKEIFQDIKIMNTIAMKLRNNRIEGGSLIFETPKKSFKLNQDNFPVAYEIKSRCESNFLVEEYMLLANSKVGEVLSKNVKQNALLRRHQFPGEKKIATFEAFMKKIGHPMKVNKHTKIQEEINTILADPSIKLATKEIIKHEMIYLLEMAQYFVIGETPKNEWLHYALNMPVYTHFTSPIRRYPDIIVHRQLISVIEAEKSSSSVKMADHQILKELVDRCNRNKMSAKKVSMGCEKIFLCLYLKDKPVVTQAILVAVEDWGFKISVPKYDCRMILKLKDLKNLKVLKMDKLGEDKKYMQVEVQQDGAELKLVLKELQEIQVQLGSTATFPIDYKVNFVFPHPKKMGEKLVIQ